MVKKFDQSVVATIKSFRHARALPGHLGAYHAPPSPSVKQKCEHFLITLSNILKGFHALHRQTFILFSILNDILNVHEFS